MTHTGLLQLLRCRPELARACWAAGQARCAGQVNFQRRLVPAFSADASGQLNQKAQAWWELSLKPLGDALEQSFKPPINPLKNPRAAAKAELNTRVLLPLPMQSCNRP